MVIKTASPGVFLKETDLTRGVADAITQNVGVVAGPFQKGPVDQLTYITQEVEFRNIFGEPTDENYEYWWSVNNFLEYSGNCYVVRCDDSQGDVVDSGSGMLHQQKMRNATDAFTMTEQVPGSAVYLKNEDQYTTQYIEQNRVNPQWGRFLSRNPGKWANGLAVAVIDRGADYQVTLKSSTPNIGTSSVSVYNAGNSVSNFSDTADGNLPVVSSATTIASLLDGGDAENSAQATVVGPFISTGIKPVFNNDNTVVNGSSVAKYAKIIIDEGYTSSDFESRPMIRVGTSVGVVLDLDETDPLKPFIKVAFVKQSDNTYGDAFDGTPEGDSITDIAKSTTIGEVVLLSEVGDFLFYSKTSNQIVDMIFEPKTYTREQGIQWFWPNRPFDGEKVYDGKVAVDLQGSPIETEDSTPSNPLYATLQGPALVTESTENPITWNDRKEVWEVNYIPSPGDLLFDSTIDALGNVPTLYEINKVVDWYSQQIAFEGIPWRAFGPRPGTSAAAQDRNASDDELNMIVYDAYGEVTGQKGSTIEQYMLVSKLKNATTVEGSNNYYKDQLNSNSSIIFSNLPLETLGGVINDGKSDPGTTIGTGVVCKLLQPRYGSVTKDNVSEIPEGNTSGKPYILLGAEDQLTASLGEVQAGYEKVVEENVEDLDYIIQGPAYDAVLFESKTEREKYSAAVGKANYLISLGERLKTAMVLISPPRSAALEPINAGTITKKIIEWADQLSSSSYAVFDSGYKYMYDRFDDKYRYVPLNSDIAGTMAQTSLFSEPFFSPAGMSRGQIRNVVKLAYDPSKDQRDQLYSSRVNAVVTFPGEGTVLYGDKTALAYSSAFNRINVRKLFIYCERQIAKIAKSVLFEFNDVPTRVNFKNNTNPFLRDVQSKRGCIDFLIVCDDSNNTPEVVDRNEFVADIYIKPNRSINFVQLNFVATKSGVSFSEAVGLNRRVEGLQ